MLLIQLDHRGACNLSFKIHGRTHDELQYTTFIQGISSIPRPHQSELLGPMNHLHVQCGTSSDLWNNYPVGLEMT